MDILQRLMDWRLWGAVLLGSTSILAFLIWRVRSRHYLSPITRRGKAVIYVLLSLWCISCLGLGASLIMLPYGYLDFIGGLLLAFSVQTARAAFDRSEVSLEELPAEKLPKETLLDLLGNINSEENSLVLTGERWVQQGTLAYLRETFESIRDNAVTLRHLGDIVADHILYLGGKRDIDNFLSWHVKSLRPGDSLFLLLKPKRWFEQRRGRFVASLLEAINSGVKVRCLLLALTFEDHDLQHNTIETLYSLSRNTADSAGLDLRIITDLSSSEDLLLGEIFQNAQTLVLGHEGELLRIHVRGYGSSEIHLTASPALVRNEVNVLEEAWNLSQIVTADFFRG